MGLAALLLDCCLFTRSQLDQAMAQQRATGERLARVLVRQGLVSQEQVLQVIGDQFHMPVVDLQKVTIDQATLQSLPAKLVYRQNCVPISRTTDGGGAQTLTI